MAKSKSNISISNIAKGVFIGLMSIGMYIVLSKVL